MRAKAKWSMATLGSIMLIAFGVSGLSAIKLAGIGIPGISIDSSVLLNIGAIMIGSASLLLNIVSGRFLKRHVRRRRGR